MSGSYAVTMKLMGCSAWKLPPKVEALEKSEISGKEPSKTNFRSVVDFVLSFGQPHYETVQHGIFTENPKLVQLRYLFRHSLQFGGKGSMLRRATVAGVATLQSPSTRLRF